MAAPNETPNPQTIPPESSTLQVDYSWKKWQALITSLSNPTEKLYTVHYQAIMSPHLTVKSTISQEIIGTGTLHPISINAKYTIHNRPGVLKALKRWKTSYTHLSYAFAPTLDSSPATMTWTSGSNFKTWDFICLDEQQVPVAKFSANLWTLKKIGNIEYLGPKANSQAAREEIIVVGLLLAYTMILRTTSILSFVGAIFARPGPIKKTNERAVEARTEGEIGEHRKPKES
ncbi:MAG: hypothetical protein Q9170_002086 [Blastenia crenularia]